MARVIADNVVETTTVTGTGDVTTAGAVAGFKALDDVLTNGDTFDYTIAAVDANKTRTGAFETGSATYLGSNQFSRDTVISSSNGDAAVSFAAGTKIVLLTYNSASFEALESGGGGGGYRGVQMRTNSITIPPGDNQIDLQDGTETVVSDTESLLSGGTITTPSGVTGVRVQATIAVAYDGGDPVTFLILYPTLVVSGRTAFGGTGVSLPIDGGSCHFVGAVTPGDEIALGANVGVGTGANVEIHVSVDFF